MPHVTIVGAGYAGVHAARTASAAGATVTVVDPTGNHDLLPRLAAVAAGRREPGDAWAPLEALTDAALVRDRAVGLDLDTATVRTAGGVTVEADAVVVTVGARPQLPPVPGLRASEARTLLTAADALRLRDALTSADALTVVGAGPTGVQLAAEVALGHPELPVRLVERASRVLPSMGRALSRRARRVLDRRGVALHLDAELRRVTSRSVELGSGEQLHGLVVWTTGVQADGNELLPQASVVDGRLVVDRALRVAPRVLAAGDVAAHRDVFGSVTAQSAQLALQAGRAAGRNAAAIAAGREPTTAHLLDMGWIVDLGCRGVAQVGPLQLAAPGLTVLAPVLHEATDLRHLWQAGGADAVLRHASGRHQPSDGAIRRAERPELRSVS